VIGKARTGRPHTPRDLALHLILDNYATHKHAKVQSWLARRNARHRRQHGGDRIVLHFTPTASSWLNLIERFFRDLTEDLVREGSFASLRQLVSAIEAYLAEHNLAPSAMSGALKG
jgi:transposase